MLRAGMGGAWGARKAATVSARRASDTAHAKSVATWGVKPPKSKTFVQDDRSARWSALAKSFESFPQSDRPSSLFRNKKSHNGGSKSKRKRRAKQKRLELQWCAKQQAALDFAAKGESFYLCGRAGTGKTALISAIVERLRSEGKVVAVTAMTGAAACLLGSSGVTMHSWAGIGLGRCPGKMLVNTMPRDAKKRWKKTDLLIIDECSMLSSELLDRLDEVAKLVRRKSDLFGGLKVMLVGDLHQLSPVEGKLLTHSPVFTRIAENSMLLTTIFRQSDPRTLKVLDEVRAGDLSKTTVSYLRSLADTPLDDDKKTVLTSWKKSADKVNAERLEALPGKLQMYSADDKQTTNTTTKPSSVLPEELHLKVGARVMYLRNNNQSGEKRLVNGSTGVVVGFVKACDERLPRVRWDATGAASVVTRETDTREDDEGKVIFKRKQLPLQLGWALTIHKAQGMTLEQVEIDLRGCFAAGQAYVALSRCKDLSKVRLLNFSPRAVITDLDALNLNRAMSDLPPMRRQTVLWWRRMKRQASWLAELRGDSQVRITM